jgi:hypothetical protein
MWRVIQTQILLTPAACLLYTDGVKRIGTDQNVPVCVFFDINKLLLPTMFMPNPFNRLQGNAMSQGTQKNTAEV